MATIFISYNSADVAMATTLASALRDAGQTVRFDQWEVELGANVALWMTEALEASDRMVALVSPDYLKPSARYSAVERAAMLWSDIDGKKAALVPLVIRPCTMPKILAPLARYDLPKGSLQDFVDRLINGPRQRTPTAPPTPSMAMMIGLPDPVPVVGRDGDVAALRAALLANPDHQVALVNSGAVLAGQGGIGKTTLARHYASQHAADYDVILWTSAATRQDIITGLCAACPVLGLPTPDLPQMQHALAVAAQIAASGKGWLVIFDNVEQREDLQGLVPTRAHCIVTTRQGTGWAGWGTQATKVLPYARADDPAPRLLMQMAGRSDAPDDARALAEDLGGLPLALVVMGAFLRAEGMGFAEGRGKLALVLDRAPENASYPSSVLGAVRLSYDRLSPDAQAVAGLCSLWANDGLGPWLLLDAPRGQHWEALLDQIPPDVQDLMRDEGRVRAAFAELGARSLLDGTGDARVMHRMTAAALRALGGVALASGAVALLAVVYPGGDRSPAHSSQYPLCARLTPHVLALLASGVTLPSAAWEYLLNQVGVYLDAIADYPTRLTLAKEHLASKVARGLPEDQPALAVAHAGLGMAYCRMQDWLSAYRSLACALDLDRRHRPNSEDLASSLDLMAGLAVAKVQAGHSADLSFAAKQYQQALALRRRLFGRLSDRVAESLNNLGTLRGLQGRRRPAARLYAGSLTILRAILPSGDGRLAYAAMNTGASWVRSGDPAKAEPLLREALEILETIFAAQLQHPLRRNAAGWLIFSLLVRARVGVNRGLREAEAKRLCAEYGFDFDERVALARQFPDPPPGD